MSSISSNNNNIFLQSGFQLRVESNFVFPLVLHCYTL